MYLLTVGLPFRTNKSRAPAIGSTSESELIPAAEMGYLVIYKTRTLPHKITRNSVYWGPLSFFFYYVHISGNKLLHTRADCSERCDLTNATFGSRMYPVFMVAGVSLSRSLIACLVNRAIASRKSNEVNLAILRSGNWSPMNKQNKERGKGVYACQGKSQN